MFPLPYKQPFNWILYVLFVLEIALLAGGLFFGRLNEERTCRLPRPLRIREKRLPRAASIFNVCPLSLLMANRLVAPSAW